MGEGGGGVWVNEDGEDDDDGDREDHESSFDGLIG